MMKPVHSSEKQVAQSRRPISAFPAFETLVVDRSKGKYASSKYKIHYIPCGRFSTKTTYACPGVYIRGPSGVNLPTASSQAFSVNAFRRPIRNSLRPRDPKHIGRYLSSDPRRGPLKRCFHYREMFFNVLKHMFTVCFS